MDTDFIFWLIADLLVIIGLAGLFAPAIPGAPLIFLGLLVAAWTEDFAHVGFWIIIVLALLALLTLGVDLWAAMFGAQKFGASKYAAIGAALGAVAGLFVGLAGVIFGPFIGAVAGEILARKNFKQAARSGLGASIGLILGAALKLALAFAMIGVFLVARFL